MATPGAYVKQYRSLTVTLPGSICGEKGLVDVGRINVIRYSNTGTGGMVKVATNVKGTEDGSTDFGYKYLRAYKAAKTKPFPESLLPAGFSEKSIQNAYQGKGSPDAMRGTLLLFGCYEMDKMTNPVARTWSSPGALEQGLNRHAEGRIGLDCLGFVVNYMRDHRSRTVNEADIALQDMQHFTGFVPRVKRLRESLVDIQSGDVIVYLTGGEHGQSVRHIAVIDTVISRTIVDDLMHAVTNIATGVLDLTKAAANKIAGGSAPKPTTPKDERATVQIAESYGGIGPQTDKVELFSSDKKGQYGHGTIFRLKRLMNREDVLVYIVPG